MAAAQRGGDGTREPFGTVPVYRDRHSLQRLAGTWLYTFGEKRQRPDFRLDTYLVEMAKNIGKQVRSSRPYTRELTGASLT
jgi:hypothetical protein